MPERYVVDIRKNNNLMFSWTMEIRSPNYWDIDVYWTRGSAERSARRKITRAKRRARVGQNVTFTVD